MGNCPPGELSGYAIGQWMNSIWLQVTTKYFESWIHNWTILPYFGKRKQVTYHPNLSFWCFHNLHNELFFQAKFHAETLILLRDICKIILMIFHWRQCKWQTHFALLREMSLLTCPFAKLGQYRPVPSVLCGLSRDSDLSPFTRTRVQFFFFLTLTQKSRLVTWAWVMPESKQ